MHLLVQDVDAWWRHVQAQGLIAKYGSKAEPPADRPWGMRDFVDRRSDRRAVAHRAKHVSGRTSATIRAMMKPPNSVLAATRTAANVRPVRSPSSGGN